MHDLGNGIVGEYMPDGSFVIHVCTRFAGFDSSSFEARLAFAFNMYLGPVTYMQCYLFPLALCRRMVDQ